MASPPEPTRIAAAVNTVARETLRRIAAERIAPTPEAYARIYAEIAATHPDHPGGPPPGAAEARAGASIIARLLVQLDVPHAGITVTRKREGLKRALVPRLETLDALFARLNRLMDSWNGPNAETGGHVEAFLGTDIMGHGGVDDDALRAHQASQVMMTSNLFAPHDGDPTGARPAAPSRGRVAASDVSEQHVSYRLAGLLAMLLKNIDELTPESALVGNQIEQIGRVLTAPLTEKKLDEAERCIRALVVRQGAIKHSIDETKRAIREFAETLLERLSSLVTSSDSYATKIVDVAERIAETDDLGKLSTLTRSLLVDARAMSTNLQAERALLAEAQEKTRALESRTAALESELREASTLVRTDPLTHALNRRGFVDAYKAELMRARSGLLPAIVLLDVDDFKRINERYGHSVGDEVSVASRRGAAALRRAGPDGVALRRRGVRPAVPGDVGGRGREGRPADAGRAARAALERIGAAAVDHVLGGHRAGRGAGDARRRDHARRSRDASREAAGQELHRGRRDARDARALSRRTGRARSAADPNSRSFRRLFVAFDRVRDAYIASRGQEETRRFKFLRGPPISRTSPALTPNRGTG